MPSLFDSATCGEILDRLDALQSEDQAAWGSMNVTQMLSHCRQPILVATGETKLKGNFFMKLMGKMLKGGVVGPKPFKNNLPTMKEFKASETADFATELSLLRDRVESFRSQGPALLSGDPHPFFGALADEEWGQLMWKHLDHHLRQFKR